MRLFIAIPLPESLRRQLAEVKRPIKGIRWQKQQQFHVTLKFLGEVNKNKLEVITSALENVDHPSFRLEIEEIGAFPEKGSPKVLWAGVNPAESLTELHRQVEQICMDLGFEPEKRSFEPHITVGRVRDASPQKVQAFISQPNTFGDISTMVTKFALYKSTLRPGGAVHKKVADFQLNPG